VTLFAIIFRITDKRIAGIHITMMASLTNQCQFMHKFYIFALVDKFGIFIPQAVISAIALGTCIYMRNMIKQLDEVEDKDWHVSDDVLILQEDDQDIDGKSNASSNYDTVFNGIVDKIDRIPALFN